jgi:crotonobetainyl-CoA:carnitine CoA-transferase CaiB-like acyl-CoA transferase
MPGPLTGKTIIEIGHMLAGPYCGMLLSDLGARVIKVESPEGDIGRTIGPHSVGGHNTYFASLNRGKESVTLDLASEEGRAGLARLVGMADGLFTNLRPAAIKKLGLTYDSLKQIKPTLACLALTGYGLDGPYADSPAYDYDGRDAADRRSRRPAGEAGLFRSGQFCGHHGRAGAGRQDAGGQGRSGRCLDV